ncbi:unnamed protein product [Symbiodinium microadriaticum]|nr:unnamed protein product [Symbiodinium microadriaticum]
MYIFRCFFHIKWLFDTIALSVTLPPCTTRMTTMSAQQAQICELQQAIGQLFQRVAFLEQSLLSLPVQMREFDEAGEKLASRITQLDSLHPEEHGTVVSNVSAAVTAQELNAIHDKLRAVEVVSSAGTRLPHGIARC